MYFSPSLRIHLTKAGLKVKVDNVECRYKLEIV